MKTKLCTKCNKRKNINHFNKHKKTIDGLNCWCKECCLIYNKNYNKNYNKINKEKIRNKYIKKNKEKIKKYHKNYREKNKIKINLYYIKNKKKLAEKTHIKNKKFPEKRILTAIKQRCNNPKNPSYHRYGGRGIKCLLTKEEIRQLMIRDCYWDMQKPSIDRINNDGNYKYNNCRFIEREENIIKGNKEAHCKPILQYDLKGNFIREFTSLIIAEEITKISKTNISHCARNKSKSAGGFIWIYKIKKDK